MSLIKKMAYTLGGAVLVLAVYLALTEEEDDEEDNEIKPKSLRLSEGANVRIWG